MLVVLYLDITILKSRGLGIENVMVLQQLSMQAGRYSHIMSLCSSVCGMHAYVAPRQRYITML